MKRFSRLAIMLMLAMVFVFAGCSSSEKTDPKVQEMVDAVNAQKDTLLKSYEDAMSLEVKAVGNVVVYTYTYKIDLEMDADEAKTLLEKSQTAQDSTFTALVDSLKEAKISSPGITVEYRNKEGKMIYSKEYK